MPQQMFPSEFNTWPADRGPKPPPPANIVAAGSLPRGVTVSLMPTPADEANAARSRMVPPAEKPKTLINIYPRSMTHEAPVPVPIYSDLQLERMSETGLKLVTSKLYDSITETGVLAIY